MNFYKSHALVIGPHCPFSDPCIFYSLDSNDMAEGRSENWLATKEVSDRYVKFRPEYPDCLVENILAYCETKV